MRAVLDRNDVALILTKAEAHEVTALMQEGWQILFDGVRYGRITDPVELADAQRMMWLFGSCVSVVRDITMAGQGVSSPIRPFDHETYMADIVIKPQRLAVAGRFGKREIDLHPWYAWWPTVCSDGTWTWRRWVWRRKEFPGPRTAKTGDMGWMIWRYYRTPPA